MLRPSQQLRPAYTDDAAFVGSASQVVGSLPHGEVFAAPVFNQVHQVPLAGGEIPENLVEIPVVPEQVISLRVVDSLPPVDEFTAYVAMRPLPLDEVRPSSRAQRHTMEDLGELAPLVQILDLPVPRTVDSVTEVLRFLDCPLEQVIFVPKISCSPCPSRSRVPEPQSADQLVEVPTVLTPTRIALQIAERIVDTPVSRGQVKAAKKELRERRQDMIGELVVLRENFLPSERTPSVERRIAQLVSALEASASSKPPKRKRKKRRKKRLPRSPRPLLRVRAHRRLRQWLVPGWFFCAALGQGWHARCGTLTGTGLMGQKTVEPQQFQFIVGRRHPLRSAEADPHGPVCSADHRDSSVAVRFHVVDDPDVLVVRFHRLFISVYSAMLGSTVDLFLRQFTEIFTFFYVNTWITDPEVDSRFSGVSTSTGLWIPVRFRISSVRQWIHIRRQSSGAFVRISYFLREGRSRGRSRPGGGSHWKSGHYFNKQLL